MSSSFESVAVAWWEGSAGSRAKNTVDAFLGAGYDAVAVDRNTSLRQDFVFTPIPSLSAPVPVHLQLGGYGVQTTMPGPELGTNKAVSDALINPGISVSVLDPNMAEAIDDPFIDDAPVIPKSSPDIVVEEVDERERFLVLVPTLDTLGVKNLERVPEAARQVYGEVGDDVVFVMPQRARGSYDGPIDWLEIPNLELVPRLSHEELLGLMVDADAVAPFSAAEILPNTVYESFSLGKPTIVDGIGRTQSVERERVGEMVKSFGAPSLLFDRDWSSHYGSGEGEHYLRGSSAGDLTEHVLDLYTDNKKREELGSAASEWFSQHWSLHEYAEAIVQRVEGEFGGTPHKPLI